MFSCSNKEQKSDAYGNFETDKVTVSAEANGKILSLKVENGDVLKSGQEIGLIDTLDLYYKKEQLKAQQSSLQANFQQIDAQVEVQNQQLENITISKNRIEKLFSKGAATQKQVDDIQGQYDITVKQISATRTQRSSLQQQINSIGKQIEQIELAISKCHIISPLDGTVLSKLSMQGEMAGVGKPIFTIADLTSLNLKAYVSGNQLSSIKIGQKVSVIVDTPDGVKTLSGTLTWVSESAEFTPKTIQTKEERVNLVYAIKVRVENDGSLKIGMPGEVDFSNTSN
jgi:HlyD family secretion protein